MPTYRFKLNDDGGGVEDDFGVGLPNAEIAHRYACDVVHELMTHREQRTRHWRLDVYDVNGEKVFEIPFASVDHTLDHLTPVSRAAVEECAQHVRSLKDARYDASLTRRESRSLVAQSRGKPYLAADRGRKVIRDPMDDRQVIQQAREAVVDLEQVLFYSKQALDQSSELLRVIDKISSPLIRAALGSPQSSIQELASPNANRSRANRQWEETRSSRFSSRHWWRGRPTIRS